MGLSGSSQKQNTNNATTSTYGYQTPPSTPDIDKLRNTQFEVDPGIAAQYGRQRNDLRSSFQQPTGAFLSPQVRDAQLRSGMERLGRDEAQASREGTFDKNRLEYGRNSAVAGLTAPQLTQTGSTSSGSGTITQNPSPFSTALGVGSALAPLSL
jgi:hypothetical protein